MAGSDGIGLKGESGIPGTINYKTYQIKFICNSTNLNTFKKGLMVQMGFPEE